MGERTSARWIGYEPEWKPMTFLRFMEENSKYPNLASGAIPYFFSSCCCFRLHLHCLPHYPLHPRPHRPVLGGSHDHRHFGFVLAFFDFFFLLSSLYSSPSLFAVLLPPGILAPSASRDKTLPLAARSQWQTEHLLCRPQYGHPRLIEKDHVRYE